ncbi:hypothetical protein PVAND_015545 [Polypedilum vanderplanki]|uniref:Uncharacterized protein n=1 Tax=Polypedilum vanderplanki TaxID=319348 RepID=A0A9J6BDB2_POLVA|nr:hypothetical protein PVAND_015545 [Polypedilum vanderplanki]
MTTPIEQMILDAKRLACRLKEKEALADALSNETERVNYQLESMRQFQDDINALNILARERSNADMIHIIHQENPQIREIQQENRQLKASIEEHQRAIELIMTKYRQHTQRQIEETKLDFEKLVNINEMNDCTNIISSQAQQLTNAIGVMQEAIRMGDEDTNHYVEQVMQLRTENQGLRELLGIARSMNSLLMNCEKKEIATQTDEAT